ncbi:Dicarboxylate/amino acid:cation symporter [Alphaproteobacteria bacterium]
MKIKSLKLWHKVILGMLLGMLFGALLKEQAVIFKPIGTIYFNMLKMIVIPIVFFAVLYGMTSMDDANTLGRIGLKAFIMYSAATVLAVVIGISFSTIFKPGVGVNIALNHIQEVGTTETSGQKLYDIIVNMIPSNPIQAMASGNTLQVVMFAFFLGLAFILAGDKGHDAKKFVTSMTQVIFKMVEVVIKTTPYGVFAIMACVIGEHGFSLIVSLGKLILVITGAFALQYMLFGLMLLVAGLNPVPFYRKMVNIQALALATASSKATLSTAMIDLQEKIGVSRRIAGFVLPLGASINMTATAIYLGVCALFFAQMTGVELTINQYFVIIITSTIGSIGAAGFPGGGVIMMSMVLSSVGLPIEGISLVLGIDRFIDMMRTMINITGDCAITVIVDKIEHTLDIKKYNQIEHKILQDQNR